VKENFIRAGDTLVFSGKATTQLRRGGKFVSGHVRKSFLMKTAKELLISP